MLETVLEKREECEQKQLGKAGEKQLTEIDFKKS